jgi:hypothetical protein
VRIDTSVLVPEVHTPESAAEERRLLRDQFSDRTAMTDVRAMITGALRDLGGQRWLTAQAKKHPIAFMNLIGRCLPIEARQQDATTIRFIIETSAPAAAGAPQVRGVLNTPLKLVQADDPNTVDG